MRWCTFLEVLDSVVPRRFHCLDSFSAGEAASFRLLLLPVPAPFLRSWMKWGLLLVKLVVMLLEVMPLLLGVHFLHFLAEGDVLLSNDFKAIEKPLEAVKHSDTSLLPEHGGDVLFIVPVWIILLIVVGVEFAVLVVTASHLRLALLNELWVSIHGVFNVEGRWLY